MEQTTIDERIFIEIEIGMRDGKVMGTGFQRGSSVIYILQHCKTRTAVVKQTTVALFTSTAT